jgi:alpha-tubulin suppressor-like RCC1 family protein
MNGTVACWGDDQYGELGTGSTSGADTCASGACSTTPVTVSGISAAIAISVGNTVACALLQGGTVQCWGLNVYGELGAYDAGFYSPVPVTVPGLAGVTDVSVNLQAGACALLSSTTVECWGDNLGGVFPSADVTGLSNATELGGFCALTYGGGVSCWSRIEGDSSTAAATVQTGLGSATAVSGASANVACALLATGAVACWGDNSSGTLGNGTTLDSTTPQTVL